jgi:hypothetical protein
MYDLDEFYVSKFNLFACIKTVLHLTQHCRYWNSSRSTLHLGRVIWIIWDVTQPEKYAKMERGFLLSHTIIPSLEAFASNILQYIHPVLYYGGTEIEVINYNINLLSTQPTHVR